MNSAAIHSGILASNQKQANGYRNRSCHHIPASVINPTTMLPGALSGTQRLEDPLPAMCLGHNCRGTGKPAPFCMQKAALTPSLPQASSWQFRLWHSRVPPPKQAALSQLKARCSGGSLSRSRCRCARHRHTLHGQGPGTRGLQENRWHKLQRELQQCDKSNNNIFCVFLYSWVSVLQSRHTSVCQFLKDMILKWNYCANKSFLLLLKFIWVISGKEKELAECILLSI